MRPYILPFLGFLPVVLTQCPDYTTYSNQSHEPLSSGRYKLSYQRPSPTCRTFNISDVETTIANVTSQITDPDLARLFENTWPNTLDTTVRWKGTANNSDEELAFVITGDIDAMWLRDSANQMQSYLALLKPSSDPNSLASLYRGVINLQARNIQTAPFCNSFQPPPESSLAPASGSTAKVTPSYSPNQVFECKYELDSLAAFLQISSEYYSATGDAAFFGKYSWLQAVQTVLNTANAMMESTYNANGTINEGPYNYIQSSTSGTETLTNSGYGNPVQNGTGLVRSVFRPSDDASIYQFLIPSNMQFSHFLSTASTIAATLNTTDATALSKQMSDLSATIRAGISAYAIVHQNIPGGGQVYAYEVDGYGGTNIMDDANLPSLLAAPFIGYTNASDPIYVATRALILSQRNPYWAAGPVIEAVGSPHVPFEQVWPMSAIVRSLTSDDDDEIAAQIKMILSSTNGLGLIHESIFTYDAARFSRPWFAWANGLFGQLIVELASSRPEVLKRSYQ
ncbi:glycoside hydrolase family 125 protein [Myriangium duriaei CBS 260.36]|uniref:Glycoside hydrolase family 125 protein n=1 Tax=Myriangium duriaei CBS 260.36 TaxID=1168546 RepID=A0A9P4MLJ8_9PEZI|nr:glycoside hydrolase family 125 protein [Myriangium duriaei CBS 260.36]